MICYVESVTRVVASLIPNVSNYESEPIDDSLLFVLGFITTYTDSGKQIIFITLAHAWHVTFIIHNVYNRELEYIDVCFNLAFNLALFIFMTSMGMLIVHIAKIHAFLVLTNLDNKKLLNGMHEGLLILTKAEKSVMLSNSPSTKLIKRFLDQENDKDEKEDFLTTKAFRPLKFDQNSSSEKPY